jgi:hypothetical protein
VQEWFPLAQSIFNAVQRIFQGRNRPTGTVTNVGAVAVFAVDQNGRAFIEPFDRDWETVDAANRFCRFEWLHRRREKYERATRSRAR